MNQYIYADNAATTKLDKEAYEAMTPFLLEEYGNASQPYLFSKKSREAIKESRITIAKCINANPEEIYFTSGGTESDNWAIKGFVNLKQAYRIVTSEIEHHAILKSCEAACRLGATIDYVKPDSKGLISVDDLRNVLTNQHKNSNYDNTLVSIMFANNEIGTIEPIKELAEISHKYGAIFHTDAVQAVGHLKIDVRKLSVDMLSASAHKFNGPKGVGFIYIKDGIKLSAFNDGGSQEFGLRAGTENVAGIVGMAVALKNNCNNLQTNSRYISKLETLFLEELDNYELPYIRNGADNHLPGSFSISFKDREGEAILHRLDLMNIYISTGSACNSKTTEISHVLKAIKLERQYAEGTIRITLGKNNTTEDIKTIARALKTIVQ